MVVFREFQFYWGERNGSSITCKKSVKTIIIQKKKKKKVGQISFSLFTHTVQFLQVLFGKALFCFLPRKFVEYCKIWLVERVVLLLLALAILLLYFFAYIVTFVSIIRLR